jgi:hypothetical protein
MCALACRSVVFSSFLRVLARGYSSRWPAVRHPVCRRLVLRCTGPEGCVRSQAAVDRWAVRR